MGHDPNKPDPTSLHRRFRGNLSDTDLRLLRVFRTVVERGGFSQAGRAHRLLRILNVDAVIVREAFSPS